VPTPQEFRPQTKWSSVIETSEKLLHGGANDSLRALEAAVLNGDPFPGEEYNYVKVALNCATAKIQSGQGDPYRLLAQASRVMASAVPSSEWTPLALTLSKDLASIGVYRLAYEVLLRFPATVRSPQLDEEASRLLRTLALLRGNSSSAQDDAQERRRTSDRVLLRVNELLGIIPENAIYSERTLADQATNLLRR